LNTQRTHYCYFIRGAKHAAMARTSIESVQKADALANVMVITDENDRNWRLEVATGCIAPGQPIMLANIEAQLGALFAIPRGDRIIFLDTDTLLLEGFATQGDMSVTWRDHVKVVGEDKVEGIAGTMPYNYGVLVARSCQATIEAFIWLRERVRRMCPPHQQWYGNQLALAELAGSRPESGTRIDRRLIPWSLTAYGNPVEIEKLPCEQYNWTPPRVGEKLAGKYVAHFKGHSRALMESYAKRLGLGWYSEESVREAA